MCHRPAWYGAIVCTRMDAERIVTKAEIGSLHTVTSTPLFVGGSVYGLVIGLGNTVTDAIEQLKENAVTWAQQIVEQHLVNDSWKPDKPPETVSYTLTSVQLASGPVSGTRIGWVAYGTLCGR